ncbi:protein ACCELERATED CELL DEATH 6-like isoform X1 [Papaver somniferum]|uniref:protein ACCELERATED CELL DEATH 6-like isoform X1 n=1 Tax=Papaver somniferum TaxID=3469 RepID=UPI000E70225A|nr:protein ACCELERATED CELL DEATH 6-like isoform X1 [Papaver somniferum]
MESRAHQANGGETCISIEQVRSFNQPAESDDFNTYRPLLDAAMYDDWEFAEKFIVSHPASVKVAITVCGRTALHIAASAGNSDFVGNLVKLMPKEALEMKQSYDGNTALHLVVVAGLDEAVKVMVQENKNLTSICNKKGLNPLLNGAIHVSVEHSEIIRFLCGVMKDEDSSSFEGHLGAHLICSLTRAGLYEVVYNLIREHPSLAIAREDDGNTMLDVLAEKGYVRRPASARQSTLYFQLSQTQQYKFTDNPTLVEKIFYPTPEDRALRREQFRSSIFVPELVNMIFDEIWRMTKEDMYHFFLDSNFPKTAAKTGSIEIVKNCISTYPDHIWIPHEGKNIFQIAVENRQENILDYLYDHMNADEKILTTRTVDSNGGNILHVAAKITPPFRLESSPVFQLQREIYWFKKVEKRVPPALRKMRNNQGETPQEVFTREHQDLVKKAETYFLRTSESCLIVAALVATVAFAAAFTVPGGNFSDSNQANKGKPLFLGKKSFLIFMVLDALALFSSTFSIQVFLSAFGMTHSEATFARIIPNKLKFGVKCLRVSVVCVVIAFSIALSIILGNRYVWAPYLIGAVACVCCMPSLFSLSGMGFTNDLDFVWLKIKILRRIQ